MPPDTRYLVGRIAPVRLDRRGRAEPATADEPTRRRLDGSATLSTRDEARGVPVGDGDDTPPTPTRTTPRTAARRGLMIPASMGLRFQIPLDLDVVHGARVLGHLRARSTRREPAAGAPIRQLPADARSSIPESSTVADLAPGTTSEYPLKDDVVLRVDRYDDADATAASSRSPCATTARRRARSP